MMHVTCKNKTADFPEGSTFEDAAKFFRDLYDEMPLLAVTGDSDHATELFHRIYGNIEINFLTHSDLQGRRAYMRTAELMLLRALSEEFAVSVLKDVKVEFSVDGNLYLSFGPQYNVNEALAAAVKERMLGYVRNSDPVRKEEIQAYKAGDIFEGTGLESVRALLNYRVSSRINYYMMGTFCCYFYGPLCPSAGYIRNFDVRLCEGGLMLILPKAKEPEVLNPMYVSKKLFDVLKNSVSWADKIGIDDVISLDDFICRGKMDDVILMQEAFFEKQLGDIAAQISSSGKKVVLLAGPSSSGKTTTAYRLAIQLRAFGIKPLIISADNYFVNGEDRPIGPDGKPDLESIKVVDTKLLNEDLLKLLAGETIDLPTFNFVTQKREYKGNTLTLGDDNVLIIEGIHCLNPIFSEKIPDESKFRIFVSALIPLSINEHNPIPVSDIRLLRRIIRDNRTRGYSAANTIAQWDNVRAGEEENILPYQENADVILNSAMIYEISVIKLFAEPALLAISPEEPEYTEARRLLKLLSFALAVSPEIVPRTSLIREFIGGSCIDIG